MRRIVALLTVVALMVVMLAMGVAPAFAAKPSDFTVQCENESGHSASVSFSTGRGFGYGNRFVAELGFHGNECQRTIE
jgi:hypothetical protein